MVCEHLLLTGFHAPLAALQIGGHGRKGSGSRAGTWGRPQTSVRDPGQPEPAASSPPHPSPTTLAFVPSGICAALRSSDLLEVGRKDALSCKCQILLSGTQSRQSCSPLRVPSLPPRCWRTLAVSEGPAQVAPPVRSAPSQSDCACSRAASCRALFLP